MCRSFSLHRFVASGIYRRPPRRCAAFYAILEKTENAFIDEEKNSILKKQLAIFCVARIKAQADYR